MSSRAKCPACGRKQKLHEGDAGQRVYCSACGKKFQADVVASPSKPVVFDVVPDWNDFPPPQAVPPRKSFKWLLPLSLAVALITGVAIIAGIFAFHSWLNAHPDQTASVPIPATSRVTTPATTSAADPDRDVPISDSSPKSAQLVSPVAATRQASELPLTVTPQAGNAIKARFHPVPSASGHEPDLDDRIGSSIHRGVDFLLTQFSNGRLKTYKPTEGESAGRDALAVYALLHAAEATHDLRLSSTAPLVSQLLDALKAMPMDGDNSTYGRSLRAAALGVYHRPQDKQALRADAAWLMKDSTNGAFYYWPPKPSLARPAIPFGPFKPLPSQNPWDNSNSQYGALGVWAAVDAGVDIPTSFWAAVQQHWLNCQLPDGEWSYTGYGDYGRLSMTVAGITTLLVAEDELNAKSSVNTLGHPPFNQALSRAITWLEAGNNAVTLPDYYPAYTLFGLERAGLASGFKYFGTHNWYSELAPRQIADQSSDGSWQDERENPVVGTAYTLLFLSRGRHPIFMNKLRFDGLWSNRPRDISNLTRYADATLERPMNWQVVSFKSDWSDWMDSPVLYIASHEALQFTDSDCDKLRSFAENGGLIFTHADGENGNFNRSVTELGHRLFPQYVMNDLPADHPIYTILFRIKPAIKLQGISNGSRLLMLNSPTDLSRSWQQRDISGRPAAFQMGINIFIYAGGKADLRNKLKTPIVTEPKTTPIATITLAQLRHLGDWDPEPAGLPRFARLFFGKTSVKVNVIQADPVELDPSTFTLTHLTGTGAVHLLPAEVKAVRDYVENGGILLIDACGASADFNQSMQLDFLPHVFPKSLVADMHGNDPILAGTGEGMLPVNLRLRPFRNEIDGVTTQPIQYFTQGKGMVIYSPVDLSTALLGTNTWAINGYQPDTAYSLIHNLLLSVLER